MYTRKVYETIGDYDPDLVLVEDFDYWQRICGTLEFSIIKEILYDYRWHDGTLTSTMKQTEFNENLEKMLLKNVGLFGKLDWLQKYYYYRGLSNCREIIGKKNPYKKKYNFYRIIYFFKCRVPNKIKRMLKGN